MASNELLANTAAVVSILVAVFAAPLVLGSYVVVQRSGLAVQLVWFGTVLLLLCGAFATAVLGLLLLG
jgi:hypothetical protein